MKIVVEDSRILVELTWKHVSMFENEFSAADPRARILKAKNLKEPDWNGRNDFFTRSATVPNRYYLKLGFIQRLKKLFELDYLDGESNIMLDVPYRHEVSGITLDKLQEDVCKMLLCRSFAAVELGTSSGKSEIISNASACWVRKSPSDRVVVLVPSKNLLHQTASRIKLRVPWLSVGKLGDRTKPKPTDNVVVMTIGSARMKKTDLTEYAVLIIDEAHHSDCASVVGVINRNEWKAKWALSGKLSYIFEQGNQLSIEQVLGQPVYSGSVKSRQCPVNLITYSFKQWDGMIDEYPSGVFDEIPVTFKYKDGWYDGIYRGLSKSGDPAFTKIEKGKILPDKEAYGIYWDLERRVRPQPNSDEIIYENASDIGIVEFEPRNSWAIKLMKKMQAAKEPFMVTVCRYRHASKLHRLAIQHGLNVKMVSGRQTGAEQTSRFDDLASGSLAGLICVYQTASEGVDCPPLVHLIKLDGISSEQTVEQQAGRLRRKHASKECGFLHVPIDSQHPNLLEASEKIVRYLKARKLPVFPISFK